MIKRFINKLLGKADQITARRTPLVRRVALSAPAQGVDPPSVDDRAV